MSLPLPPPSFFYGLLVGASVYLICSALSPILTKSLGTTTFKQNVEKLDRKKLYHYHSLFPSTVHALLQIIGTFTFVFYGREGYDDVLADGASPAVVFDDRIFVPYGLTGVGPAVYMGIFVGYLLVDVAAAPSFDDMGYPYVIHHLTASACWTFCACNRIMQPVASLLQFNELSTPLMNIRQYLLTAGYKSSDLSLTVISLMFFATFALVRVAPLPFALRDWILRDFDATAKVSGASGGILLSLFFAVNAALQCTWFLIMCQRFVGMMSKKQPKQKVQ